MRTRADALAPLALGLLLLAAADPALGQARGYPTRARSGEPLQIALDHLETDRARLGLESDDLDALAVDDRYLARRTGITHLYLKQRVDGIDVFGGNVTMAVDRDGRILTRGERLVRNLQGRIGARQPTIGAAEAVARAADHLGIAALAAPHVSRLVGGPAQEQVLEPGGVSRDEIPAKLEYVPREGGDIRIAWNLVIRTSDGRHWWNLHVDARTGAVLRQNDWMRRDSYNVFPGPLKNPDEGPRSVQMNPADPTASPYGWHDTNGAVGAEFTDTRGNNVHAQEDEDANDSGGERPSSPGLDFNPSFLSAVKPGNNRDAAVTNLFYWNNRLHDILYQYGFDEAAGNFQVNNYGNGGSQGDPVQADALDGEDDNNATFGTPPDGQDPRMQMYRWLHPTNPDLVVLSPDSIDGSYPVSEGAFGGGTLGLTGNVLKADPDDACSALTNAGAMAGKIALIDRGTCLFIEKVEHAQDAGAIGAIIVNNAGNGLVTMAGYAPDVVIPAVFIGQSNGQTIEAELGSGVSATLITPAHRDSDFENAIIIHEYGHGLSNRLVNGRMNVNCLVANQSQGMGEGWSDWLAMAITADAGDQSDDAVPIATYVTFQSLSGPGIRTHPYSTDIVINPHTYEDIGDFAFPFYSEHGVGSVWAAMLWEVYWNLVDVYGFDPDLYAGSGGNNLAIQLVVDGLKLMVCDPSFVQARDEILMADVSESGGANRCLIYAGFAKRGLGFGATGSSSSLRVSDVFGVPPECAPSCGDGLLQVGETCDDGNTSFFDGCSASCGEETILSFVGSPTGGTVDLAISGISLQVPTSAGQSVDDVAANVAAAINADPDLTALGVSAAASGNEFATDGDVTVFEVNDPGLGAPAVPALSAGARALLAAALLLIAALSLRLRRLPA